MTLFRVVAIVQFAVAASCGIGWAGEADKLALPEVVFGRSNEACIAVIKVIRAIKNEDIWAGPWRDHFGLIDWMGGTYPTVTAEGRHANVPFRYTAIDINNDGRRDVVVIYTDLLSSAYWDWLYLFDPKQFRAAQKEGAVGKLFQEVPALNRRNILQFQNGQSGNPVELHLWRYKGAIYILAKEHFFAKQEPHAASSFFVAKLGPHSTKWDERFRVLRLVPELTCRMVAK